MSNSFTIARVELLRLFKSPLAWLCLAFLQLLLGIFFFTLLYQFMQPAATRAQYGLTETVIVGVFQTCGMLLLLLSPMICMRLFSEELRTGTMDLLSSSPIAIRQIVLGKYLATVVFMGLPILICTSMLLSLNLGTQLDGGLFLSALVGLLLLSMLLVAIGMFSSSLTRQPAVAAITAFIISFMLWIIHIAAAGAAARVADIVNYLSLLKHFNQFLRGLVTATDLAYFILFTLLFILLTIWRLDARLVYE